jgi:hypothetical protein
MALENKNEFSESIQSNVEAPNPSFRSTVRFRLESIYMDEKPNMIFTVKLRLTAPNAR